MELMQQEVKGYSDSREDDDEEETAEIVTITREESRRLREEDEAASTNWMSQNHRKQQQQQELELMELSLGSNKEEEQGSGGAHVHGTPSSSNANEAAVPVPVEKEQMFDKVVTPSDVGKLNRLVIPKQHAEKYFPLDSSSNEKGLLLNFEDRNGKLWRFRYSYWNSSQSYVMTKGWSRFVKEKKLDAGDIVSFQRGVGELYRHRLYIDWRRRDHHHHHHHHAPDPSSSLINPFFLQNQYSIRWNARFYSLPSPPAPSAAVPQHFHHHHHLNYNNLYAIQQQQQQVIRAADYNSGGSGGGSVYYLRSASEQQERERRVIIDSVPVAATHHHNQQYGGVGVTSGASGDATNSVTTTGKRLRLFGVNMECASSAEDSRSLSLDVTMATPPPNSSSIASSSIQHRQIEENSVRGSVLFDLDPSLQYRRH